MSKLVDKMQSEEHYHGMTGISSNQILAAQDILGVRFSDEYAEYLKEVGVASFDGHEITGVCVSPRLDVVQVTEKNRVRQPDIPDSWYVIEETNIDQIVIWQAEDGKIYRTQPNCAPTEIAQSLLEYISK